MKRILIFMTVALFAGLLIISCGGEKEGKSEKTGDQAVLPQDTGESTLLDTTVTEQPKPQPTVAEKQPEAKPQPKPQPKPELKPEPKPVPKPQYVETVLLNQGDQLEVEMLTDLSTETNKVGDKFRVMVLGPAEKGQPSQFPEGTIIEGEIAQMSDGKSEGESAWILPKFTKFILPGENGVPMEGYIVTNDGDGVIKAGSKTGTVAKDAGIGAIAGGVLGAITGGNKKTSGAAKGAVVGAAAGGILGAVLHKDRVEIKNGNKMDIAIVGQVVEKKLKE